MNRHDEAEPVPTDCAEVRVSGMRHAVFCQICGVRRSEATNQAIVVAAHAASEHQLLDFVRDQIDGRDPVIEAAIAKAHPQHSEDVAYKIVLFALGLLYMRPDLATHLQEVLQQGGCSIDIQLRPDGIHVNLVGTTLAYETAYLPEATHVAAPKLH